MNFATAVPSREQLLHALYESAELEHNLMCTYLYAAFSLRDGVGEGLSEEEAAAVARWRRAILDISIDEMGHLAAVLNIGSALGGSPRFGRGNFPLDPGGLPAGVVVKLAPFGFNVLQHFIYLERPDNSSEEDGEGFAPEIMFTRGVSTPRLTPMGYNYDTVGEFYATLTARLSAFVEHHGEDIAFSGDAALQLSPAEVTLKGAQTVICLKTAAAALKAIIEQGEGAPANSRGSHFQRFLAIRAEYLVLKSKNPDFTPAFPAAVNPLLRRPVRSEGRVWITDETAANTVDLANAGYALMLRLLAYSYVVPRPQPQKALAVDLSLGLMRAMTLLAERAARLPAGDSHPNCNAGMSFTALRDAAPLPPGISSGKFFMERFSELSAAADKLAANGDARIVSAARMLAGFADKAKRGFAPETFETVAPAPSRQSQPTVASSGAPPTPAVVDGVDEIEGEKMTLVYEGKKCIHARHCVTWGPNVFLANVQGPWIHPDAMDVEGLTEIAHVCPSGAIRYRRKDGVADEAPPLVNLIAVREGGPYAVRADMHLNGKSIHYRATLCRCGASKNKPYCDSSHHEVNFSASGEPETIEPTDMLPVRNGPLNIETELNGPLSLRGNIEITSGTGRMVTRRTQVRLCRCGGSNSKPFCDGTHMRNGFKSE